jgi:acetyl-CoA acetyltransferase
MADLRRLSALCGEVAVVGVGETDYAEDYVRTRRGEKPYDSYGYAALALNRALADAGLTKDDLDGLIVGGPIAYERMAEVAGIEPGWSGSGDAPTSVTQAVMAITAGFAETVAIVYGNNQRTAGTAYGGPAAMGGEAILSYVYFAPWGMTSQGALYAMMTRRYMEVHGLEPHELGQVAVGQRAFAAMNPNAVMRKPIDIDDYLAARYITEPLRLYDYCLINDGGVAMVLTTRDRARRGPNPLVTVAGLGRADENIGATTLRPRLVTFYHEGHAKVREQVYGTAGISPGEVDVLGVYDSFSCHIPYALEGMGFCEIGDAGKFLVEKGVGPGGAIPTNTSGGHLSESYMQGWNHQPELVRQARGTAGERQVPNVRNAQWVSDVAGNVISLVYRREV